MHVYLGLRVARCTKHHILTLCWQHRVTIMEKGLYFGSTHCKGWAPLTARMPGCLFVKRVHVFRFCGLPNPIRRNVEYAFFRRTQECAKHSGLNWCSHAVVSSISAKWNLGLGKVFAKTCCKTQCCLISKINHSSSPFWVWWNPQRFTLTCPACQADIAFVELQLLGKVQVRQEALPASNGPFSEC